MQSAVWEFVMKPDWLSVDINKTVFLPGNDHHGQTGCVRLDLLAIALNHAVRRFAAHETPQRRGGNLFSDHQVASALAFAADGELHK
jgi:hypothetical protein